MGRQAGEREGYKIKLKQREEILKRLRAGETHRALAYEYDVTSPRIQQISVFLGKPKHWKKQKPEKDYQEKKTLVIKRLSEVPNVSKVLKEFGLKLGRFKRDGITLTKTKGYLIAKEKCRVCATGLNGFRLYGQKLCRRCGSNKRKSRYKVHKKIGVL